VTPAVAKNGFHDFKQWGAYGSDGQNPSKRANGRRYLGEVWNGMPAAL
jgi:protein gp37